MAATTDNVFIKENEKSRIMNNVWYKTVRLTINVLLNILIFFTVFVCLLYSWSSNISFFDLHIILCVLGYQFCMCHGTLIMSPFNSWSMFITRRYKKHLHWVLQLSAAVLVTVGTVLIYRVRNRHFVSTHGKLGLAGLVFCLLSLLNGILAMYPGKLSSWIGVFWIRFFHYITGLASMFLGTGSLCVAFEYRSFKAWAGDNADVFIPTLVFFTWLFTILVSLDFWIITGNKIRSLI